MKASRKTSGFEASAAEALTMVLGQVSALRLKALEWQPACHGRAGEILAQVDVLGHSHTLACELNADSRPSKVRAALRKLDDCAAHLGGNATAVLIAPHLSAQARALCSQNHAGFLDLEGNARISVGEVFIGQRSLKQSAAARHAA